MAATKEGRGEEEEATVFCVRPSISRVSGCIECGKMDKTNSAAGGALRSDANAFETCMKLHLAAVRRLRR